MIETKKRSLYRHQLEEDMKPYNCKTAEDVFDFLFGTHDNDYYHEHVVYHQGIIVRQTIWNRLNSLWVYPLFLIIAPFRYVAFGHPGFNRDSKIGRIVLGLVGQ